MERDNLSAPRYVTQSAMSVRACWLVRWLLGGATGKRVLWQFELNIKKWTFNEWQKTRQAEFWGEPSVEVGIGIDDSTN